jgi:uncharacterized cupin superfamily protein
MVKFLGLWFCAGILFSSWAQSEGQPGMKIIHLDATQLEDVVLTDVEDYPFMKVIDGDNPKHGGLSSFTSADGKLQVGFSHYSTVTLQLTDWYANEFMYFLEGQVEITDEEGSSKIYGPGDAIVMPKGFNGTWRQLSPIKKIHVSYPVE